MHLDGSKLQKERLEKGWFQKDLAKELGCSTRTITRWETEKETPRLNIFLKLVKIFGYGIISNDD